MVGSHEAARLVSEEAQRNAPRTTAVRIKEREREKAVYSSRVVRGGDEMSSLASWLLCLALFPLRVGEWKEVYRSWRV